MLVQETSVCGGEQTCRREYPPPRLNFSKLGNSFFPAISSKMAGSNESKPRIRVFIWKFTEIGHLHRCDDRGADGQSRNGSDARRRTGLPIKPPRDRQAPGTICHLYSGLYTFFPPFRDCFLRCYSPRMNAGFWIKVWLKSSQSLLSAWIGVNLWLKTNFTTFSYATLSFFPTQRR